MATNAKEWRFAQLQRRMQIEDIMQGALNRAMAMLDDGEAIEICLHGDSVLSLNKNDRIDYVMCWKTER